jgi:hypothetical protein
VLNIRTITSIWSKPHRFEASVDAWLLLVLLDQSSKVFALTCCYVGIQCPFDIARLSRTDTLSPALDSTLSLSRKSGPSSFSIVLWLYRFSGFSSSLSRLLSIDCLVDCGSSYVARNLENFLVPSLVLAAKGRIRYIFEFPLRKVLPSTIYPEIVKSNENESKILYSP